ncbi:GntR family transcriptional regulator [Paraglaciecola sp.]|uniref:GntR family transcriptional regulator n=1 Tax=Paraglaciecola sp. TaxID=1920173 RepID=UPI003EF23163
MDIDNIDNLRSPLIGEESTVYNNLLNDIARAMLVSGDRLVSSALAKRYNSSVNTVREALNRLQGEGLVTVEPNSGARVTLFEYRTMRDVFELLQLLEPYLIEWFVQEHSPQQMQELHGLVDKMERLDDGDHLSYRLLDTQFHWAIYSQHYNESAVSLWRQKRLILQTMHSNLTTRASRANKGIAEHRQMLACIEKRDTKGTLAVLEQHITESSQYWSRFIDKFNKK